MAMSNIIHLDDSNYAAEVAQGVVVVDFWAPWCGPCRALAPSLEKAADAFASQLRIAKYNVDEAQEYAAKLGIRSIPTLAVYKDGELVHQQTGGMGYSQLEDFLKQFI